RPRCPPRSCGYAAPGRSWGRSRNTWCWARRSLEAISRVAPEVPGLRLHEGAQALERQCGADARVAAAAPREAGRHAIAAVPIHRAGVHAAEDRLGLLALPRVHARGEAVLRVVHESHGLLGVAHTLDADDGAEALVAHHLHAVVHVDEHRGLEPVAAFV